MTQTGNIVISNVIYLLTAFNNIEESTCSGNSLNNSFNNSFNKEVSNKSTIYTCQNCEHVLTKICRTDYISVVPYLQ